MDGIAPKDPFAKLIESLAGTSKIALVRAGNEMVAVQQQATAVYLYEEEGESGTYYYCAFYSANFDATYLISILKEPVEKALVQVAASEMFKKLFDGAKSLGSGKTTLPSKSGNEFDPPLKLRPAMWFPEERILVTVVTEIASRSDLQIAEALIPVAFERASAWINQHGCTHPFMTFRIIDGRLDPLPALTYERPA